MDRREVELMIQAAVGPLERRIEELESSIERFEMLESNVERLEIDIENKKDNDD